MFHKLSMQFAISCFNYDQSSKSEFCWIAKNALFISQLTRLSEFPCTMKLGLRLCDSTVKNTFGNECRKKFAHWQKSQSPQRHMDLLLMNTFSSSSVFLYMVHHSADPCCRMWPEWRSKLDKLDNLDKGLQSLSEQTEGENNFLLLKDYCLTSHIDSPSEREERNQQWLDKKPSFGPRIIVSTWHTL